MSRGHTLLELSAVLALLAIAGSAFVSVGRGVRDRMAVTAAREEVAGLFAEARTAAMAWGGATVRVRTEEGVVWYEAGGRVHRRLDLAREAGVTLVLARGRTGADLAYDALGLGRVASETLRFRRREAESGLVVSGYGRVRRW